MQTDTPVIVDPSGRPARKRLAQDKTCPRCRAGAEKRVASGFGVQYPICGQCGLEFHGEAVEGGTLDGR